MTFEEKTLDETIEMFKNNAEHERIHGNLQGCLGFSQLVGWLVDYKRLLKEVVYESRRSDIAFKDRSQTRY